VPRVYWGCSSLPSRPLGAPGIDQGERVADFLAFILAPALWSPTVTPARSLMYRPSLLPTLLDYLVRNRYKLPFHTIIFHKFPLAEVNQAMETSEWNQRQTKITRAVLVP
jgi:hypothetical protein